MDFTIHTYDETTIRENSTTQIAIRAVEWPGNTFLLWLPESVGDLWNQWTPAIAHEDFTRTQHDALLWTFDRNPAAVIEAELTPLENSLSLEVRVFNRSQEDLLRVSAQNCFHLSAAPDFACDDFSRIYIRSGGKWRSLSSLKPTCDLPMYYRPGFFREGRRDSWGGRFAHCNQAAEADHPLIVCVSKDHRRCVGTASEDCQCVFHNRGNEYLRCIHSQQAPVPVLRPGATAEFRQRIYFADGRLMDCISAFEAQSSTFARQRLAINARTGHDTNLPET